MAWVVPMPSRSARFAVARRVAVLGVVAPRPPIKRAEFRRAAGGVVKILGLGSVAAPGGGTVTPPAVVLPAAWLAVAFPVGFIGPLLGQLALVRGEAVAYSAADGSLSIGGRRLIGTAGKVFEFASQGAADMWVSVNSAKVAKELALLSDLPAASVAAWKTDKAKKMQARAVAITANAARMSDAAKRSALTAEAGFYLSKWS